MTIIDKINYAGAAFVLMLSLLLLGVTLVGTGKPNLKEVEEPMRIPALHESKSINISEYSIISEKPAFVPGHRAPPPVAAESDAAEMSLPAAHMPFSLIGIMISKDKRIAVIQQPNNQGTITLQTGQSLDGWTITDIRHDMLILNSGETRQSLRLADDKNTASQNRKGRKE